MAWSDTDVQPDSDKSQSLLTPSHPHALHSFSVSVCPPLSVCVHPVRATVPAGGQRWADKAGGGVVALVDHCGKVAAPPCPGRGCGGPRLLSLCNNILLRVVYYSVPSQGSGTQATAA